MRLKLAGVSDPGVDLITFGMLVVGMTTSTLTRGGERTRVWCVDITVLVKERKR